MPFTPSAPRIGYSAFGDSGPTVLLIMGFGMRGVVWRPQTEGLKSRHRVLTYDHLGIGESDPPAKKPTMASMARDALRVLDAAGVETAHVVGVSMGGMIAQEVALANKGRVKSLTLIATHAGGVRACLPTAAGLRRFVEANLGDGAQRVAALKHLLYTPEFLAKVDQANMDQRILDMAGKRAPRETLLGHLGAVLRHRTRARLGAVEAPTLIVRPGRDVLVAPTNSDVLARGIPNATLTRFDAGHGITFECAAELNQAIEAHVERAERALKPRVDLAPAIQ